MGFPLVFFRTSDILRILLMAIASFSQIWKMARQKGLKAGKIGVPNPFVNFPLVRKVA
jgi:hypothetical protein